MDAAQALQELTELSSQVERAVVLDAKGALLGSTTPDDSATQTLARAALELVAAAGELQPSGDVTLAEGGLFVLRDGKHAIAATTGPSPTAGLVVYDLRTCLRALDVPAPKRRRTKKAEEAEA
jgi:Roadblock/LC7 domain